jgi:hypothetical protein
VAERFELFDEAAGAVLDRVAAGEPVGAELAEGDLVAGDVVVGDAGIERGDRLVERVDVGEQTGDEDAVVGEFETVGERLTQLRDLRPQVSPSRGRPAPPGRSHRRAALPASPAPRPSSSPRRHC